MDQDDQKILKQILARLEHIEKKLQIQSIGSDFPKPKQTPEQPKILPLTTTDRLAKFILEESKKEAERKQSQPEESKVDMKDLRENYDLGEIVRFALKKKMLVEAKEEESNASTTVIVDQ